MSDSPADDKPPWFRRRTYAHFDLPSALDRVIRVVDDPSAVAKHRFWPLILKPMRSCKRVWENDQPRWKTKTRPIAYVAHMDAQIHARYAFELSRLLDVRLRASDYGVAVLAYRKFDPKKCNVDFAHDAFSEIAKTGECDVVALDVSGFFDALDHRVLKDSWADLLGVERLPRDHFQVYRSVTRDRGVTLPQLRDVLGRPIDGRYGEVRRRIGRKPVRIVEDLARFRREIVPLLRPRYELVAGIKGDSIPSEPIGIPQGTPISAVLANVYMRAVDEMLFRQLREIGGSYRRYSDDILVIAPPGMARRAEELVSTALDGVHLEIKPAKTARVAFRQHGESIRGLQLDAAGATGQPTRLDYLGLSFDGRTSMLRSSTISRFQTRMQRAVHRGYLAALKSPDLKLKKRKLYATVSSLGHGQVYGTWDGDELPEHVPRRGFHNYLDRAARITGSEAIRRQGRQLDQMLARAIRDAEQRLAKRRSRMRVSGLGAQQAVPIGG